MQKRLSNLVVFAVVAGLLGVGVPALASETNGTITSSPSYAWGENIGWMNFAADQSAVVVTDTTLTGYIWTANYGWINLRPGGAFGGVTNSSEGTLGGYAWSALLGPISFTGVTISTAGVFRGTSNGTGTTAGRITFDCTNCTVRTDWRPQSVRGAETPAPASSSGSGSRLVQHLITGVQPDPQNNPELGAPVSGQDRAQATYPAEPGGTAASIDATDNQVPVDVAGDGAQPDVATTTVALLVKNGWWALLTIPLVGWYVLRRRLLKA